MHQNRTHLRKIVCIGAEDDAMWDTCRYIRRMQTRLAEHPHTCTLEALLYTHGTHFVLPQSMVQNLLPVGSSFFIGLCFQAGRQHPGLCKTTRLDIDQHLHRSSRNGDVSYKTTTFAAKNRPSRCAKGDFISLKSSSDLLPVWRLVKCCSFPRGSSARLAKRKLGALARGRYF